MALLVLIDGMDPDPFVRELRRLTPDRDIRTWPQTGDKTGIRHALVWRPPRGELATYPNLQTIVSLGAGVDHLMADPDLPHVPVVRFVDPDLTLRMREYVVLHALLHQRRMLDYAGLQRAARWQELEQPAADEIRVGVMGLGVLGADCARMLARLGFKVAGWSRSPRSVDGVRCHSGAAERDGFLARTDILVCLLPLTNETRGLLDRALFARLARNGPLPGPVLINAGRGGLQVETDILDALDTGALWACSLDVFEEEPLPASSPLWHHPRVVITPHTASVSDPRAVARYALGQIACQEAGKPLTNLVDLTRGY